MRPECLQHLQEDPRVALAVGQAVEMVRGFGGTNYSLSLQPGAWGIIWAAEKPRVSELEGTRPSRG